MVITMDFQEVVKATMQHLAELACVGHGFTKLKEPLDDTQVRADRSEVATVELGHEVRCGSTKGRKAIKKL